MGGANHPKGYLFVIDNVSAQTDDCILWPWVIATSGYAQFVYRGDKHSAHRFMCQLVHGDPPSPQHHASHACGVRHCINPRHLSWKTPAGNMADKRVHGTYRVRTIGMETAREIRKWKGIEGADKIASRFGITESNIRRIWDGAIWNEEHWEKLRREGKRRPFTVEEVLKIRSAPSATQTKEIASWFDGANYGQVQKIRAGKTYAWVR